MEADPPRFAWGHINVNVRDLDRSVAFYAKLGFHPFIPGIPYLELAAEGRAQPMDPSMARALGLPDGVRGRACILQLDEGFPKLDLTELEIDDARPPLHNKDVGVVRICLASQDLAADYARLSAAGVEFLTEPGRDADGLADVAVCVDPDGTRIELIEIHGERWLSRLAGAGGPSEA